MARNDALYEGVLKGKRNDVAALVQQAVDDGVNVEEILMDSMVPAMAEIGGETVYKTTADDFAAFAKPLLSVGADFIGGCCGTNPDFIRQLQLALQD